jgi:hypothetical protein
MELRRSLKCAVIETVFGLLPRFTSWLSWMPKGILPTKFRHGLLIPTVASKLKRVSSARLTSAAPTNAAYVPTVQRLAWLNNTTYY